MSLLQTLRCQEGHDSPLRFAVIQINIVLLMILMSGLSYGSNWQVVSVALVPILCSPIALLSGWRRLHQANTEPKWAWGIAGAWWWVALCLCLWPAGGSIMLLVPAAVTVYFCYLPAVGRPLKSQWGYSGPCLVWGNEQRSRREPSLHGKGRSAWLEPTAPVPWDQDYLDGDAIAAAIEPQQAQRSAQEQRLAQLLTQIKQSGILERLERQRFPYRIIIMIVGLLLLLAIAIKVVALVTHSSKTPPIEPIEQQEAPTSAVDTESSLGKLPHFDESVILPDNFGLGLIGNQLVIQWNGQTTQEGEYWSQSTGHGDRRCQSIQFNSGVEFRPLVVKVQMAAITLLIFLRLIPRI
ncbi:MAG: hypothetical protein R3Y10_05885 [Ferrimonas sp.]